MKLTKNALRDQESKLKQLSNYLPTLKLKKSLLQLEVNNVKVQIENLVEQIKIEKENIEKFSYLLTEQPEIRLFDFINIKHVSKTYENIAGVEIPSFEGVIFEKVDYFLYDTPLWTETAVDKLKNVVELKEKLAVVNEKKQALEKDLRDVSIRVNLFEKVLIPRCAKNIKKIKIFLQDQDLAAISQAKVAKNKIKR